MKEEPDHATPKDQATQPLIAPAVGICACGCGRQTKIVTGKYLKYFRASHHPNHRPKEKRDKEKRGKKPEDLSAAPIPPPPQPSSPEVAGHRLSGLVQRLKGIPGFIAEQRLWLGARQRESDRKYVASRRKTDPGFKLLMNLRGRIGAALKGVGKSKRTIQLVGCSIAELKIHLQRQFRPGMNWENYGDWHVDHIIPCCSFNLLIEEEQHRCFHFANLQPLLADENFKKSGKYPGGP